MSFMLSSECLNATINAQDDIFSFCIPCCNRNTIFAIAKCSKSARISRT